MVGRPAGSLGILEAVANISGRNFVDQPCWLAFTVHGSRHSISHNLCFPAAAKGRASLELDSILARNGFGRNEMVKDISWKISESLAANGQKGALKLTLNDRLSSLRDHLVNEALFSINGVEYLPVAHRDVAYDDKTLSLDFGKLQIEKEDEAMPSLDFRPRFNSFFSIDTLVLARTEPITISQFQTLNALRERDKDESAGGGILALVIKAMFVLAGAALIWLAARYGLIAAGWAGVRKFAAIFIGTLFLGWRPLMGLWLLLWFGLSAALYAMGLFWGKTTGENYFFTFGGITAVLAWRAYVLRAQLWLRKHCPGLAETVYAGAGSYYFLGAVILLVIVALLVSVRLEPIAEQFAVIVYYMLVAGVFRELVFLSKNRGNGQRTSS